MSDDLVVMEFDLELDAVEELFPAHLALLRMRTARQPFQFDFRGFLFSDQQLVDTIGLLGNFTLLSMCLNMFQVDLQADRVPPFPDVRGYAKVDPAAI